MLEFWGVGGSFVAAVTKLEIYLQCPSCLPLAPLTPRPSLSLQEKEGKEAVVLC